MGDCQPNSLEFAIADPSGDDGKFDPKTAQRYMLSKGDMFQIPPGNWYRIENHSKVMKASLFWTSQAEQEDDYEAVPVSDYKEDYPPGEEPKTPGGSTLRRSRRAKFKDAQISSSGSSRSSVSTRASVASTSVARVPGSFGIRQV